MLSIQQGDMLKISGLPYPMIVVSNDFFNQEGKIIACPIVRNAAEGPLHIRLKDSSAEGYVLCEQLKYIDLATRRFSKLPATHHFDIIDISDAIMGIFDYQCFPSCIEVSDITPYNAPEVNGTGEELSVLMHHVR